MYLGTVIFGLLGVLSILRFAEMLFLSGSISPMQPVIGVVALVLAWACLKKARSS